MKFFPLYEWWLYAYMYRPLESNVEVLVNFVYLATIWPYIAFLRSVEPARKGRHTVIGCRYYVCNFARVFT